LFKAGWLGEWPGDNGFFHRRYERDDMSEVNVTTKSFVPDVHRGMAAAAIHESGLRKYNGGRSRRVTWVRTRLDITNIEM